MEPKVIDLAARLQKASLSRIAIDPLSDDVPDLDLAGGYAVQQVLREAAGPLAGWKLGIVADNASAGRFVVGTPVSPVGIDLRLVGVVLEKNGEVVATASGAASLGHPAAAVAWMVRTMAADGAGLHAGDIVLSGGLTAATPVGPGDMVVVSIDRLGGVELGCR
jgi:2-keto-4-pentenoate hydratase